MNKSNYSSTHRHYRAGCVAGSGETAFQVVVEQTDLWVVAREDLSAPVHDLLRELRGVLKGYMLLHPEFGVSMVPVSVEERAHELIQDMALAARRCNVGPMAAVAGSIAQRVVRTFVAQSPDIIVENGGDIAMASQRERVVALLPDPEAEASIGLKLVPEDFPTCLCSSSSTIGHSLSLGQGELVVVRSPSGAFADAAATALCNILREKTDLEKMLETAQAWAEHPKDDATPAAHVLEGVFAQCKGQLAVWGNMELAAL